MANEPTEDKWLMEYSEKLTQKAGEGLISPTVLLYLLKLLEDAYEDGYHDGQNDGPDETHDDGEPHHNEGMD